MVGERLNINTRQMLPAETQRDVTYTAVRVIPRFESAQKPDHQCGTRRHGPRRRQIAWPLRAEVACQYSRQQQDAAEIRYWQPSHYAAKRFFRYTLYRGTILEVITCGSYNLLH